MVKRWTVGQSHFLSCAEGPSCEAEGIPDHINYMKKNNVKVWNNNTHLGVDLKTQLRSDRRMKSGKSYQGVLRRDLICEEFLYDEHFTFTETLPPTSAKRNPRVYDGRFITITRRDDGSYRPNFKPMPTGAGFRVERYATGVANELLWALEGLVEEV